MDPRLEAETFWPRLQAALEAVDPERTQPPEDARVGAVLVLLHQAEEGPRVVLTRRRRDMRSHPGQISFAGGRLDEDETIEEAALREAQEEIGLDPTTVEVVGLGPTFYIPPSRFWVVPVVARWRDPHPTDPNPWEVDEVLEVPIAELLEEDRWRKVPLSLRGASWAWQLDSGDLLWGATAVVMSLLLEVAVEDWSGGRSPEDLPEDRAVTPWEDAPSWQRPARLTGELPERSQEEVPHVTTEQMRAVDRIMADRGLGLASLVEQAGRAVAHTVRRLVDDSLDGVAVTLLAGTGGNGAGGLAAARLLSAAGAEVEVLLTGEPALPSQLDVLDMAGISWRWVGEDGPDTASPGDVVVDAMLGYGAEPPLRGVPDAVNAWLQRFAVPVVALDLPSGLSADEGLEGACVNADVTVTLGAPKEGLRPRIVHPYVGDLYLADIGIPPAVWRELDLPPVTFPHGPLVRLTVEDRAPDAGTPDQGEVSEA
ncbi:MAG: NAD(P)H-hydrate epimerase [Nitriliruptorales bacterium]|nr:NAD(P)H-hydrate epimerase [Nitriliruptorales bacterium]